MAQSPPTTLKRGEVVIDYAEHGARNSTPLLLVMGLGMQRTAWPPAFLDALCAQGFRCISFDNRDIGLSSRYDEYPVPPLYRLMSGRLLGQKLRLPYSLADIAADGAAVLDHLRIPRAHVLGMSMGGMVAQHIASAHPLRVESLTLMSTTSGRLGLPPPALPVMKLMLGRPTARTSFADATDYMVRLFSAIGSPAWPMQREEMVRRAQANLRRAPSGNGVGRQLAAIFNDGDRTPLLRSLEARTLVLHGHHDRMVPFAHARQLAQVIPRARLHGISGWGHDLPDELIPEIATLIAEHALLR